MKISLNPILLIIELSILPIDFCHTQTINIDALVAPCVQEQVALQIGQSNFNLAHHEFDLPLLEKVEARSELDRMLTSRQEFMLRTSFNSLGQRKAEKSKMDALIYKNHLENNVAIHDLISDRYFDLVNLAAIIRENDIIEKEIKLLGQKEKVSSQLLSNGVAIDLEDLIKLKQSLLRVAIKKDNNLQQYNNITSKLKLNQDVKIQMGNFPTLADVLRHVETLKPTYEEHPDIVKYEAEERYLSADLRSQKAKTNKILDFVQAKYTVRDDLLLQNRFSVGLGVAIPWSGTLQLKKQENIIKQEEIKLKKNIKVSVLSADFEELKSQFFAEWKAYQLWSKVFESPEFIKLKGQITESGRLDPLKILDLQDAEVDAAYKTIEHESKIYEIYIKLLENSGLIYELPYKNYLHRLHPYFIE